MREFVKVATTRQVPEGDGILVEANGREIGLFRIEGRYYAIDNVCPHRMGPLVEGQLKGCIISCPWHAWTFDITTGKSTFDERVEVETFDVRVDGDNVEIAV